VAVEEAGGGVVVLGGAAGSAGRKYRGGKRMIMVWGEKSECDCACLCLAYERIAKVTKKIYV